MNLKVPRCPGIAPLFFQQRPGVNPRTRPGPPSPCYYVTTSPRYPNPELVLPGPQELRTQAATSTSRTREPRTRPNQTSRTQDPGCHVLHGPANQNPEPRTCPNSQNPESHHDYTTVANEPALRTRQTQDPELLLELAPDGRTPQTQASSRTTSLPQTPEQETRSHSSSESFDTATDTDTENPDTDTEDPSTFTVMASRH